MIKTKKLIKYCAIAFAIFLTINIISAIMFGIITLGNIFSSNNDIGGKLENLNIANNINYLDIEVANTNIILKQGNILRAETNNKYLKLKERNNKLIIEDKRNNLFGKNNNTDLIIYLPVDQIFNEVSIENGAGRINIEFIKTQKLELELGAGRVEINNVTVTKELDINGGAGKVNIINGNINNLDLDMGIGSLNLESTITGYSDIEAGIGDLNLKLIGSFDNYKLKVNKGIGIATLNGKKIKSALYYGEGPNLINIDGGIGNININYTR